METLQVISLQLLLFSFIGFVVATTALIIVAYYYKKQVEFTKKQADDAVIAAKDMAAKIHEAHNKLVLQVSEQAKKTESLQMQVGGLRQTVKRP